MSNRRKLAVPAPQPLATTTTTTRSLDRWAPWVVVPADYNQAYAATTESYERAEPTYIRFGRPATPAVE